MSLCYFYRFCVESKFLNNQNYINNINGGK